MQVTNQHREGGVQTGRIDINLVLEQARLIADLQKKIPLRTVIDNSRTGGKSGTPVLLVTSRPDQVTWKDLVVEVLTNLLGDWFFMKSSTNVNNVMKAAELAGEAA